MTDAGGRRAAPGLVVPTRASSAVVGVLTALGLRPLVVGGTVRDALLAAQRGLPPEPPRDLDLEAHGDVSTEVLGAALAPLGPVAVRGAAFLVVSVVVDGEEVEVSVEPLVPGRSVAEADRAAAARRDLTVGAIAWDPVSHELVDPHGGEADLARGVLRHVSEHFGDDPLRGLRVVQLAGRLGFAVAAETAALCRELLPAAADLPVERIWAEWRKLARRAVHWPEALVALEQTGWLARWPDLAAVRDVPQDPAWHPEGDVWTHLGLAARAAATAAEEEGTAPADREVAVLGALLHDLGKATHTQLGDDGRVRSLGHAEAGVDPARRTLAAMGAPRAVVERVLPVVREHMTHVSVPGRPSGPAVRRLRRRLAPAGLDDWARVVDADAAGRAGASRRGAADAWREVSAATPPTPGRGLLTGRHLIDAGLTPGPVFRETLRAAAAAEDDEAYVDEAGAVRWLAARLG